MKSIKVHLNDGDSYITSINGTSEEIESYFIGKWFNFGIENDVMKQCIKIEELKQ